MTADGISGRQDHKRRPRLLSDEEVNEVVARAVQARAAGVAVDQMWTRHTIGEVTNGRVCDASGSFISKFWNEQGWPSWQIQERCAKGMRPTILEEAAAFQQMVIAYLKANSVTIHHFHIMDETGLWTGSVAPRTYVNPATRDPGVIQPGDHRRDTGIVTLTAD